MKPRKKKLVVAAPGKAIAYIRVSTVQQAADGNSLDAQKAKLKLYAELVGFEIVGFEVDAGESAGTLERPALQRALGMLDRGEAQALMVVKLDRLTRSLRDLATLVSTYFREGARRLLSASEQIDTSTAGGRMTLNILTAVSEWEREAAAERTAAVMSHLKASGTYTGGFPPYGYTLDDEGSLVESDGEQATLATAREMRASGKSLRNISAWLGVNPRTGKPFAASQIARML